MRAGWGGDGIHITNRGRDGYGCERQARSSAWVHLNAGSTREEHTPSPRRFQKPSTLSFLLTPLCPCIAPPPTHPLFLYLARPHLFICPAGCATKTLSPSSKWSSNPHMLCSAHFPTPQRWSLVAKIEMRKGCRERERERWGREED